MATEVLMPKLGLTMEEGTIEEWKFNEGDAVKSGDVLFSVSTDKLTNDIEAEADGILLKILSGEGSTVPCKEIIAYIGAAGESIPVATETHVTPAVAEEDAKVVEIKSEQAPARGGNVTGCVKASPYAKKLAREKNLDISLIVGSGPNNMVIAKDVESYTAGPKMSPTAAKVARDLNVDPATIDVAGRRVMKADVLAAKAQTQGNDVGEIERPLLDSSIDVAANDNDLPPVKVSTMRKNIANNMSASWSTSPRVTFNMQVDTTAMKALRKSLKAEFEEKGIKLTYNHIIMKVCAQALKEFVDVNASFSENMLTRHKHANVGLAVAAGDGLMVPNIKACEMKSLSQIAVETQQLIDDVRNGTIDMSDITGGTFTITSLGPFGIESFSPIINQPELAILGVCDIIDKPVVVDGEIVIRPMMNLSLTADHRVIDGVQASRFLSRIVNLLENPYLLLA